MAHTDLESLASVENGTDSECYPDPSLIASTNLNLSRLSSPMNSTTTLPLTRPRTNTILHKPSFVTIHSSQTVPLAFNNSTSSLRRCSTAKLHHQPSKLDLIDDTTLTSLPLPPPPKQKRTAENTSVHTVEDPNISFSPTHDSDNEDDTQDPIVLIEDYMTPLNENPLHKSEPLDGPPEEDQLKHLIERKRSLATFKQRMFNQSLEVDDVSISDVSFSSTLNFDSPNTSRIAPFASTPKPSNKRSISHDIVSRADMRLEDRYLRPENLEEIFGKIPGSDLLKYCDLCEKPLYEISSIINNNKKFKTSTGATPSTATATPTSTIGLVYSEFICWECIETYEEFLNELSTTEQDKQPESSSAPIASPDAKSKLLKIFQTVQDKYTQQNMKNDEPSTWTSLLASKRSFFYKQPTYKQLNNKTSFSETLMQRLNYLNNVPEGYSYSSNSLTENKAGEPEPKKMAPKKDLEWIKNLQAKLSWTWKSLAKPLGDVS